MKYFGTPMGMWTLFNNSFRKQLGIVFNMDNKNASAVMAKAKVRYKEIIGKLPEFEKGDRFKGNIISCAMLSAIVLSVPERPNVNRMIIYYRQAMMISVMKWC